MPQPEPQPRRRLVANLVEGVTIARFTASKIVQEEDIHDTFEQLEAILREKRVSDLVLDFRKVKFLSSAVLGRLILVNKKLRAAGGRVVLCGIANELMEVFKLTQLDKVLTIKKDVKEALGVFGIREANLAVDLEE
jgi:anti-sigma B factor antagonist